MRRMLNASFAVRMEIYKIQSKLMQILATFGYKEADIVMLTDDAQNPRQVPTKENMVI